MSAAELRKGQRVRFYGDRLWWVVRDGDERFTILTRQATFHKRGVLCYTIIDRERDVRGPCNLIGQGYGDGTYDDAQCAEMLAGLRLSVAREQWFEEHKNDPDGEHFQPIEGLNGRHIIWPESFDPEGVYPIEVSYRNNVAVRIEAVA